MKTTRYLIKKMDCPTEEQLIRNRLQSIDGIATLAFNLMASELTVEHQLDDDAPIVVALEEIGMKPEPAADPSAGAKAPVAAEEPSLWPKALLGLAGVAALGAEMVAWKTGKESSPLVITLSVFSMAAGGRETLKKGLIAVKNFTLNINFLMTLAIVGAVAIGQWPEAAMVTVLFALAERIEAYSLDRARNAVRGLMAMTPATATVKRDTSWVEVEAESVAVGELVQVKPGERIPLDGKVVSGRSSVNQAPITGESIPVNKEPGDPVFAGTVNELGALELQVTANRGNTTLDRIVRSVQQAQAERAPTQRFIDKFARYYTPVVMVLAILVAAVPPLAFGTPFYPWFYKALVMLVIACPCALVISTPVTVVSGLAAAAKRGILIKGGAHLEAGRRIKVIALDKTGTLTHGKPEVTDIVPLNGMAEEELLALAASVDAQSEHPVGRAIVAKWTHGSGTPNEVRPAQDFESITGRGVKATLGGRVHYMGSHRLAEERNVCSAAVEEVLARIEAEGKTAAVLTTEHEPLGVLAVADTPRDTSIAAVKRLRELGIVTVMLTGDNARTGAAIGKAVGIDDVRGDLLPEDKVTAIDELLAKYGAVGMVGDGINDAPALAKATIGFAMGAAGTDTAIETADVALMQDDLGRLPEFIELSRRTGAILSTNIVLALGIKLVFFGLALTGKATLWMAVFADMGASLLVVLNGLRLLRPAPDGTARLDAPKMALTKEVSHGT